jgi:hypothetical protein
MARMFNKLKEDYKNNSMNPKRIQIKKIWEDSETTKWIQRGFKQISEWKDRNYFKKKIKEIKKADK